MVPVVYLLLLTDNQLSNSNLILITLSSSSGAVMVTSSRVQRLFVGTLLWVIASRCRVVAVMSPSHSSPPSPPILSSAPFRYKDFVLKL